VRKIPAIIISEADSMRKRAIQAGRAVGATVSFLLTERLPTGFKKTERHENVGLTI
jgi:hypothetical protein